MSNTSMHAFPQVGRGREEGEKKRKWVRTKEGGGGDNKRGGERKETKMTKRSVKNFGHR